MTSRRLGVAAALVDGSFVAGDVRLEGGLVAAVGLPPAAGGGLAAPGLVDLQVNGYAGVDFLTSEAPAWHTAERALARAGVTAYVANLITARSDATAAALRTTAGLVAGAAGGAHGRGGSRCLGAHLEGPFLSSARRGTHPEQHLRLPSRELLEPLLATGPVVGVTIAPELPGAIEVIGWVSASGVLVALGHSDATADAANAGFDAGARTVTHVFNAMNGLTSRAPGLAGTALARADVAVQAILDGQHLSAETAAVVVAAAGRRLVLVSDALAAAGAPDGTYRLGDVDVTKVGDEARHAGGGLAGSVSPLISCVRRAVDAGATVEHALAAASSRPAQLIGRTDLGLLRPGDRADVVVLDDTLTVSSAYVAGALAE
jgi:N-acetylglucosamine-6-phosphate deacetylase